MKRHLKFIITIAVTVAVTFSLTSLLYFLINNNNKGNDVSNKLDIISMYIDEKYLYDEVDYDKLNDAAIKAYVDALEEPYTKYYSKSEFDKYLKNVEESYTGIGVVIVADMEKDMIMVVSPIKDSPAYNAGIKPGDYIISVDGTVYPGSKMQDCVDHITGGQAGTNIRLAVVRDGKELAFEIERGEITETSVTAEMLCEEIGYIAISNFNINSEGQKVSTYTEFVSEVGNLQSKGMKRLIIDLRDNPGGVLEVVCDIADYILPKGIITYTETRTGKRDEYLSDAQELAVPIVVLINGNSASASEVLTGALKDHGRAVVVGERSYGKGIVQKIFPFADGSGMSMTISKYYTPKGDCIHGVGIEPDYVVATPEKYKDYYVDSIPEGEDTQLNKAIEIIKTK